MRPVRLLGDGALAGAAAAGDSRAYAEIYRRYHQPLYRFCRSLLLDSEDANDALQNTMAAALQALPGEQRAIELRPWLYRVARNECVSMLRRRKVTVVLNETLELPAPGDGEQAAELQARLRQLVADLQALPERQRSALVMRELSGLEYDEIALALETSAATAKQAVYEARLALQDLEEGRAMRCEDVREVLSARDGRARRGRKLRAHMRACGTCEAFAVAIERRRGDFALLAPPMAAPAAAGVLAQLLALKAGSITGGGAGTLKAAVTVMAALAVSAGGYTATRSQLPSDAAAPNVRASERDAGATARTSSVAERRSSSDERSRALAGHGDRKPRRPSGRVLDTRSPAGGAPGANRPVPPAAADPLGGPTRPAVDPGDASAEPQRPGAGTGGQPMSGAGPGGTDGGSPASDYVQQTPTGESPAGATPAGSVIENVPSGPGTAPPPTTESTTVPGPPIAADPGARAQEHFRPR